MKLCFILFLTLFCLTDLTAAKKGARNPEPVPEPTPEPSPSPFLHIGDDLASGMSWISGSASFGSDITFWWLDDSFSANLIEMTTTRDTPLFYTFQVTIDDLFGFKASANLYLDKILNPLGLFSPDLSLGLSGTSGGAQSDVIFPWNLMTLAGELLDENMGDGSLFLEFHYKYRLFRWENKIVSKWLDTVVDYYDEKGVVHLYAPGSSFSTGSRWSDYILGVGGQPLDDYPMGFFVGMEYWELLAPTLLDLMIRDTYTSSADVIMQTWNKFLGLRTSFSAGVDGQNPETLENELGLGVSLGMTIGSFSGSNDYFQGPGSLGSTMFAGLHSGLKFELWEGSEGYILLGLEGTFSLLNTFGSAEAPGKALKDLPYHAIGGSYTLPAGAELDVSISRWETFGGPYLKAGFKF